MKKIVVSALTALTLSAGAALAADMPVKAVRAPAAPPAWDLAFGSALTNDYIFRGITQSNHKPSVSAYFEPRYNINPNLQLYAGIAGNSISFPNRAAAEIDLYAGIRPTFGAFAFDFGVWRYWYPGGQEFGAANPLLPSGNFAKADWSFTEVYGKVAWTVINPLVLGLNVNYSPNILNTGSKGTWVSGTAKYSFPTLANGMAFYTSGEFGRQILGTSDAFYLNTAFTSYNTWNLGLGWAYKVFTVDLRYSDTNLTKTQCNAFTSDHTANAALESGWCGARFIGKLSADLTVNSNLK